MTFLLNRGAIEIKSYWFYLSPLKLHGRETADNSQLTQWESKCTGYYIFCCPTLRTCIIRVCLPQAGAESKFDAGAQEVAARWQQFVKTSAPRIKSSAWVLFCRVASEHIHAVCFEFALPYQQGAMSISRPRTPRASLRVYQRKVTKK